jgi:hypothetical protein
MGITDLLANPDRISVIADQLETNEGPCPYSRLLLTSWLIMQLGELSALEQTEQEGLSPELCCAYRALIGKASKAGEST